MVYFLTSSFRKVVMLAVPYLLSWRLDNRELGVKFFDVLLLCLADSILLALTYLLCFGLFYLFVIYFSRALSITS